MIESMASIADIQFDVAAVITAISLIIGSVATLIVALKDRKSGDSESKAVAVTRIDDTDKKVETLIQQVDFLFDEIGKLRKEKDELVKEVTRLRAELKTERSDHAETKRQLAEALAQLKDKNERIQALESVINKKGE